MKKDDFTALGISEELAEKAAAASAEELKGMVPRDRLNEVTRERDQLKTAKEKAESDLEDLKKSAGDNTALQQQITQLQQAAAAKDTEHAAELKALRMGNAIRMAITDAQDAEIVTGLIDQSKLILGDDGKVTGLEEQLKTLREDKPFLFKAKEPGNGGTGFRVGSTQGGTAGGVGSESGKQLSMKEAIAAKLQSQTDK